MTQQLRPPAGRPLGRLAGLDLAWMPSTLWGMAAIWIGLGAIAYFLLGFNLWEALLGGLSGVVIHWCSEFWHQYGHVLAARRTGYPMTGLRFWGIFSTSLWPPDEPPLPGRIHIQRALGGPIASILLGVLALLAPAVIGPNRLGWWLAVFAAFDNLLVLGLGAFAPLGFTDGSTILYWWRRR
jgi:hypothetical protein